MTTVGKNLKTRKTKNSTAMRIRIILRHGNGCETEYDLVITRNGTIIYDEPLIEKLRKALDKAIRYWESKGLPASICFPSLEEILQGRIDYSEYASSYCADVAETVLSTTWEIIKFGKIMKV